MRSDSNNTLARAHALIECAPPPNQFFFFFFFFFRQRPASQPAIADNCAAKGERGQWAPKIIEQEKRVVSSSDGGACDDDDDISPLVGGSISAQERSYYFSLTMIESSRSTAGRLVVVVENKQKININPRHSYEKRRTVGGCAGHKFKRFVPVY